MIIFKEPTQYISDFTNKYSQDFLDILVCVSGGVDSTTSAILLKKAGRNCKLLLIDTGFMRKDEIKEVKQTFKELDCKIEVLDKKEMFYESLKDISKPKKKRKVFRKIYFKIFKEYLINNKINYIAQGTQFWNNQSKVYHNSPPKKLIKNNINIIEPVKGLSKDNIRDIAKELKLPEKVVERRPFPGPGLLLRIGGKINLEKINIISNITHIIDDFIKQHSQDFKECYQIFPYLMDGMKVTYINKYNKGDFGFIILIRAIRQKHENKTINYLPFSIGYDIAEMLVNKIMELEKIARVTFDHTPKFGSGNNINHGGTIEYI